MARRDGSIEVRVAIFPEDGDVYREVANLTGKHGARPRLLRRKILLGDAVDRGNLRFSSNDAAIPPQKVVEKQPTPRPKVRMAAADDDFAP